MVISGLIFKYLSFHVDRCTYRTAWSKRLFAHYIKLYMGLYELKHDKLYKTITYWKCSMLVLNFEIIKTSDCVKLMCRSQTLVES